MQRIAAQSDRVPRIAFEPSPLLRDAVAALPPVLKTGRPLDVEALTQHIADGICRSLCIAPVVIRVALRRPPLRGGELHGLYTPGNGRARDRIDLWMLTAKRGQVVAFKTFLRTFLHEICHHLDYHVLHLQDSLHTQGFYQRESSLFATLGGFEVDGG